ncbi:MAG TPA: glycosyltransferase family 4 protein [Flavobacterium sp.]|uniref:glycosyltransferase family 4 protein n=1 Tax=Flavobacterium sp. TaxID=239 RepID=UPI002B4B10D4|nr:glycosyltransferase family 4 protein [Flavobacterium sp.]HLO73774.1 glycosyltransferase family 4 protein [Flavobacterium sp.]
MKLLVITNIPTPYRIAFFNVLQQQLLFQNGKLKVLYCAENEPDRHWEIDFSDQQFEYEILKGFHATIGGLFLHFNPSILKKTAAFNPDYILYAGSWNMPTVVFSLLFNSVFNTKYKKIFWSEGHDGSILHKSGIVPTIRKFIQNKFDAFAVPNQRSESYLFTNLRLNEKPILILPNTVDGNFFTKPQSWNIENSKEVKSEFNIPNNSKIIIQVSQIEDRKGVVELVSYWQKLQQKENYHLVLVGEGSLKNKLIAENQSDNIHFLGNQTKENVRKLLFASDVFVLLTKNDPNPLTLIEASFAKLPILTTKFAGNCDEIVVGENGVVLQEISFATFENAFQKMKQFSSSKSGEISFQNVKQNFDSEQVARNFMKQLNNA